MTRIVLYILIVALVAFMVYGILVIYKPTIRQAQHTTTTPTIALSPAPTAGFTQSERALYDKYHLSSIHVPAGFSIRVFAELAGARSMSVSENGTVYVGSRTGTDVYAVVDANHDGYAEDHYVVASGLHVPNGVAYHAGDLYVGTISQIFKIPDVEKYLDSPAEPTVVYSGYPSTELHGWKFIGYGPDNRLYVPVGAPCDDCVSGAPYASMTRLELSPTPTQMSIFAHGIRNTVGFDWHPVTHELWFTDNGPDALGDDRPADELNVVRIEGAHYGFPFCHGGDVVDPVYKGNACDQYVAPVGKLTVHGAALGMRFYTGRQFPGTYKNQIFIAEHGSEKRKSGKVGYRVMLATIDGYKMTSYTPFAAGWVDSSGTVIGRPVDVAVWTDGSLLVSDDQAGAIYRISYSK